MELPAPNVQSHEEAQQNFEYISGFIILGKGNPAGTVAARQGTFYIRKDGGIGTTLYVKEVGDDVNGWAAK